MALAQTALARTLHVIEDRDFVQWRRAFGHSEQICFATVAEPLVSIVDMDAQGSLAPIPLFVCGTIAVEPLLEALLGLRRLQLGQSETYTCALLGADGQSARHGS